MLTKVVVQLALSAIVINVYVCIVCFLKGYTVLALINIICLIANLYTIRRLLK